MQRASGIEYVFGLWKSFLVFHRPCRWARGSAVRRRLETPTANHTHRHISAFHLACSWHQCRGLLTSVCKSLTILIFTMPFPCRSPMRRLGALRRERLPSCEELLNNKQLSWNSPEIRPLQRCQCRLLERLLCHQRAVELQQSETQALSGAWQNKPCNGVTHSSDDPGHSERVP